MSKIQVTYKQTSIKAILTEAVTNTEHRAILVSGINKTFKVTDKLLIELLMLTVSQKSVVSAISKVIYDYLEPRHKSLGNKATLEVTEKEFKISIVEDEPEETKPTTTVETPTELIN
jgi:hypothetical protein